MTTGAAAPDRLIRVSAVVIQDAAGRVLTLRKRGTSMLMLPGGKPEPGEGPRQTALREFAEELGVELDPAVLAELGEFRSAAANEPGYDVVATVFLHPVVPVARPHGEIEHLEWVDPAARHPAMAPLNSEHIFPVLLAR